MAPEYIGQSALAPSVWAVCVPAAAGGGQKG